MNTFKIKSFIRNYYFLSFLSPLLKCIIDSRYIYYYIQRKITSLKLRKYLGSIESFFYGKKNSAGLIQSSHLVEQLIIQGYTENINIVTPTELKEIYEYFASQTVYDPIRPQYGMFSPFSPYEDTHVGHFLGLTTASAPHVLQIANNPVLIQTVSKLFSCKPILDYVGCWWSYPGKSMAEEQQFFHRDLDSLQFIKCFIYLTDVDESSGPHIYVKGSHELQWKVKSGLRISDKEVSDCFESSNVVTFTGNAGTCFLENTFGVHKGQLPVTTPRLVLQFIYAVKRTPFFSPKKGFILLNQLQDIDRATLDPDINKYFFHKENFHQPK